MSALRASPAERPSESKAYATPGLRAFAQHRNSLDFVQPVSCRSPPMPVVNREIVLPVPRERAWELITEPSELEEWLGEDVEFEAEEDAPLRVDDREGFVEEVCDGERIVFTWGDSRVEWILEDHPEGTRFLVTEH